LDSKPGTFVYSAAMLREYGNLSSAFIYFAFEAALADEAPPRMVVDLIVRGRI
jgi:predicted naringenin-chalcone synthase